MEYSINPVIEEEKRVLMTELNKLCVINSKESNQIYIILMLNLRNITNYRRFFFLIYSLNFGIIIHNLLNIY